MIAIEMGNTEKWTDLAEKHNCTFDEAKDVMVKFAVRGFLGNYEDEISQLNHSVYSRHTSFQAFSIGSLNPHSTRWTSPSTNKQPPSSKLDRLSRAIKAQGLVLCAQCVPSLQSKFQNP